MITDEVKNVNINQPPKRLINVLGGFQKASARSTAAQTRNSRPASTSDEFTHRIEREFIEGSAIDAGLYAASVGIIADTEQLPGGEVAAPIHDALNWKLTRFGQQARSNFYAALLLQEDGSCWQAKLDKPRLDTDKTRKKLKTKLGRVRCCDIKRLAKIHPDCAEYTKYETPVGNGARAFLPTISVRIRQLISDRCGVAVPLTGSFWGWLEQHPEIEIIFTEGGKKALSLLSLGYVAIALYGVNGGYSNVGGVRSLIPDVTRFAQPGRKITLAFDQDAEQKTRKRVNIALCCFGGLLEQSGCEVSIAQWNGQQGKGVDDLIATCGANAFHTAYSAALRLNHWQLWQRLEHRLTYPVAMRVNQADLSSLDIDRLPPSGIISIASAKGTGKTKLLAETIKLGGSVLAAGHRIALMRNLCERLKLDYRGDLDKVNGRFTNGAAYALRIGFCVDSLLAIDPSQFAGCDLILDEVVQVVRHLLTSKTCQQDGKRPALLTRFAQLIRVAKRVIVADADLDNATLHYLKELRGDDAPVFLIRNDYQAAGYPVRFLEASNRTAITAMLMRDVAQLKAGKVLFVTTDNKGISRSLASLIAKESPNSRVLVVNGDTSGGKAEREFIANPDAVLARGEYDIIIVSPSLATGVSIEIQGIIDRVYGIYSGASSADADIAQSLMRVRDPVERVVWCARVGQNFSDVSRSTNSIEVKRHLQDQMNVIAAITRCSLQPDTLSAIESYDWQHNPHVNLFVRLAADQNRAMFNLRDALLVRLRYEGNQVSIEQHENDAAMRLLLRANQAELRQIDAEAISGADQLTFAQVTLLQAQESLTVDEKLSIANFYIRDFYGIETLTVDDVLMDREGRHRGELMNLEAQLYPNVAADRTARALEKQAGWNQGLCPWDVNNAEVRRKLREFVGLEDFFTVGREWTKADLAPYAAKAREIAPHIKTVLHFSITPEMSDVQVIHQLLSQLGLKTGFRWSRSHPGFEGQKIRIYRLDAQHYQQAIGILERRKLRREAAGQQEQTGSPHPFNQQNSTGDPNQTDPKTSEGWASEENLADVRLWLEAAAANPADESIAHLLKSVPPDVLRRAIT